MMTLRSLVGEHIKNENGVRKNNSYTKLYESLNKDGVVIKESTTTSKSPMHHHHASYYYSFT